MKMALGEAFVGAIFQFLLEKLISGTFGQIMKHVNGVKIDDEMIHNLENSMRSVTAQLQDAEQQQQQNRIMLQSQEYKKWVEDLQDLAFDLQDLLGWLATDHDDDAHLLRTTTYFHSAKTKVKNIVGCGSRAMQCFQYPGDLSSKINELSTRLQECHILGRNNLGLSDQNVIQHPSIMQNFTRETTSLISERIIYGREEKKNEIIQLLLNNGESNNEMYDVISIVGTGGVGKTTLAQYAYNDHQLNDYFKFKAWVCVSNDKFDLTRVTRDLINSATGENLTFSNLDQSHIKLAQVVKDKKFLIVLDDVWTISRNDWLQLLTPFLQGSRGSKVIITTREERTARMMSRNQTHTIIRLQKLSTDDCWNLFKRHAYLESDDDVAEMKSDIITKCDGLPLAAKALGGLFINTLEKSERQSLLKSGIWKEKGDVLPVLRLSYFHLPFHLKRVFAYCSIFPKDYKFEKMEVILLWMAQGMLPENKENTMEVIGHNYFLELVSSSLFERIPSKYKELYVMHDLVHDLSQWAAGDLCCCVMDTKSLQGYCTRTRHLNLNNNVAIGVDPCISQLRTFMSGRNEYIDTVNAKDFISRFQSIRTLYLASDTITKLSKCIGDLKLLRHLDMEFPEIRVLPKSIRKLCNLQTLILSGCYRLKECKGLRFLVKLRHVRFPESLWEAIPVGIGELKNLQTTGDVILGEDHGRGSLIRELKNINQLCGNLNITRLVNVRKVDDAREAQIHQKSGLERLGLHWFGDGSKEDVVDRDIKRDVLEELKPNSCIKQIELQGYSGLTWPSWLGDPSFKNMVELRLVRCYKHEQIPPLGQLPLLKKLVIKECESFQGTLPPFLPCLKILRIKKCPQAKVSLPSSPNPKFEVLKVESCKAILSSTEMLAIHCSEKMHIENIKSGLNSLQVIGPCRKGLFIKECDSLVSIENIPVTAEKVNLYKCRKLDRVEWEEASTSTSTSSPSNNNGVFVTIEKCDSVVVVGNIPLIVANLVIEDCALLEDVMFGTRITMVDDLHLRLAQLVELGIFHCPKLMSLTDGVLMPSLQKLRILESPKIQMFPKMDLSNCLEELNLGRMNVKQRIQEWGLERLTHLKSLTMHDIGHLGDSIDCIIGTDIKDDKDDTILHLPSISLRALDVTNFKNIKTIKCSTFPNLTTLRIRGSQNFVCFRDGVDCGQLQAARIRELSIYKMDAKKPIQQWGLELLTHLQHLTIGRIRWTSGDLVESIVGTVDDTLTLQSKSQSQSKSKSCSALYLPSLSLRKLIIHGLPVDEKLREQQSTIDMIQGFNDLASINCSTFPHLTKLRIWDCPMLESLGPNNDLPPKLEDLVIMGSPLIEQQCTSHPKGFIRFNYLNEKQYTISNKKAEPRQ